MVAAERAEDRGGVRGVATAERRPPASELTGVAHAHSALLIAQDSTSGLSPSFATCSGNEARMTLFPSTSLRHSTSSRTAISTVRSRFHVCNEGARNGTPSLAQFRPFRPFRVSRGTPPMRLASAHGSPAIPNSGASPSSCPLLGRSRSRRSSPPVTVGAPPVESGQPCGPAAATPGVAPTSCSGAALPRHGSDRSSSCGVPPALAGPVSGAPVSPDHCSGVAGGSRP
jgi:hypothetical protein